MTFMEWIQHRLLVHDFNPGLVDGLWGRNTRNAVIAFQTARDLSPNGQLNNATIAALRLDPSLPNGVPIAPTGAASPTSPIRDLLDYFPWMQLAISKKGLHEATNNVELRKFLKSDGKTLGDPAQLPWCGDFVETCVAVALPNVAIPSNPYLARNWLKFGMTVDSCFGSVLVFWRQSVSGTKGHVGFYYSEDKTHYHVLGGNQSNKISVSKIAKSRLLGARLPIHGGPYPRKTVKGAGDWKITTNEF